MLDLLITWLPIIGGAILAVGLGMYYGTGNKSYGLWINYLGLVIIGFGLCLHLQKLIWIDEGAKSRTAVTDIARNRAYVLVETVNVINADDDLMNMGADKIVHSIVVIKNSGQTPATNVKHRTSIRLAAFPPPDDLFNVPQTPHASVFVLARDARGTASAGLGRSLTVDEKTLLGLGTMAVYVFGEASYDSFGTRFCTHYRYMVGGNIGFNGTLMSQMAEGNYTDRNCTP